MGFQSWLGYIAGAQGERASMSKALRHMLHRELALMRRAGVPAWDVLKAASIEPGRFLGRRLGVAPGDEASLVILSRNPITDVANTTAIKAVIQRGKLVDREALLRGTSVAGSKTEAAR